jgi:RNA polymerase sigma factor (sigma-70 family)
MADTFSVPAGAFATTRWSLVLRARDKSDAALEILFGQYRQPLLVWLKSQGLPPADAEDLLHGFLEGLLRRNALSSVAREKGRFRTFLLACLKNHLKDEHDKRTSAKRGAGQLEASLDDTDEESQAIHQPASGGASPDLAYDRAWAESVLDNSLRRLAEECAAQGHAPLCAELEPVMFYDDDASPYAEIGRKLGMSEGAVKMAASRIRRRLRGIVCDEIMQTVANEQDWQDEVRYLIELFSRPS